MNFLTVIILNLMLAFSVLLTPKITSAFLGGGISNMAAGFGSMIMGAMALTPMGFIAGPKALALGATTGIKNAVTGKSENQSHNKNAANAKAQKFHQYQQSPK